MSEFIEKFRALPDFYAASGSTEEQIIHAEQELGVHFAQDYCEYLLAFGSACACSHELTGICTSKRLNVVDVTRCEREFAPTICKNWYVVEQANIDGIVVWQNKCGVIYQTMPGAEPVLLANSIWEYLNMDN